MKPYTDSIIQPYKDSTRDEVYAALLDNIQAGALVLDPDVDKTKFGVALVDNAIAGCEKIGGDLAEGETPLEEKCFIATIAKFGDCNLDGKVTLSDVQLLAVGVANKKGGWENGDYNESGEVDESDLLLLVGALIADQAIT